MAFTVGPLGFHECVRMLFGLTNTPATFQHLMETCLGELHLNWCIIYLDDIIIFSKTPQEHLKWLRGVFECLAQAGLNLKPSKCEFFRDSLRYLGHIVSKKGIATDPKKIETILNWLRPKTVTDVRSFTGFRLREDRPSSVRTDIRWKLQKEEAQRRLDWQVPTVLRTSEGTM